MNWIRPRLGRVVRRGRGTVDKAELIQRLELAYPGEAQAVDRLKWILLAALLPVRDHGTVLEHARRRGISRHRAEQLLRGDVAFGFRWETVEKLLADCGADPVHIEVARELFAQFPRGDHASYAGAAPRRPPRPAGLPARSDTGAGVDVDTACETGVAEADSTATGGGRPDVTAALSASRTPTVADADRAVRQPTGPSAADDDEARSGTRPADGAALVREPDPATATTARELLDLADTYRVWKGEPSYRQMSERARNQYVASTFNTLTKRETLPKVEVLLAYLEGCGAGEAERERWRQAWFRIKVAERGGTDTPPQPP
ncbi:hypothetical protein ABZ801_19440 [Actinomadura sp. NPDC047616]|uniref:hypothetical protein n=1 Tax=Actinomadura sp. NPDC047616 TaxID=3155914 RepID=UPI0034063971